MSSKYMSLAGMNVGHSSREAFQSPVIGALDNKFMVFPLVHILMVKGQ